MALTQLPDILCDFKLSDAQTAATLAGGRDVAVTAGAGTGKTRTLVGRYLALLDGGMPLRQIAAVTFTRKAGREMRNRVRQEIGAYLRRPDLSDEKKQAWQTLYNELDAARIGTIHTLCAEILRAHPAESGIDPQFTVLDETQAALLLQETAEAALGWAVETEAMMPLFSLLQERQLQDLILALLRGRLTAQHIVAGINPDSVLAHWRAALRAAQAAILERLLAGEPLRAAEEILADNQALNSDDRIEVQRHMALAALGDLSAESRAGQLRAAVTLAGIALSGGSTKNWPGGKEQLEEVKGALRALRQEFEQERLLAAELNEQDEALAAVMPAVYGLFQQARTIYQALKQEREALDFDDLEELTVLLLENNEPVRLYWQGQIQALLVDEFQDTNELQSHFLRLLCAGPGTIFIVGDAKQSIYRFRGADVTVFAGEKRRIGEQNGALVDLDESYRAHELLLEGMNCLLEPILGPDTPDRPPWVAPFAPLKSGDKTVGPRFAPPFVEFHLAIGTKPEALPTAAAALAARLARLRADYGLDYGDMAILCRASGSFQFYENALDAAGIPYLTVAGKGFYERPEVRDLLNALQAAADPQDDLALAGLLRSPACGISDVSLFWLVRQRPGSSTLWDTIQGDVQLDDAGQMARLRAAVALIRDLNRQAGRTPAAGLLKQFLDRTYYRAVLRSAGQPRALRNITKLLDDVQRSEQIDIYEFLAYAQLLRDSGTREGEARATSGGAVQIMSIHAAKGLEFPIVILGDAGSGGSRGGGIAIDRQLGIILPVKDGEGLQGTSYALWAAASRAQDEAESARVLYVALTRAKELLLISGTAGQTQSGALSWRGWLGQLADVVGFAQPDLSTYDEAGDEQHIFAYAPGETAVRVTFYEPQFAAPLPQPRAPEEEPLLPTADFTLQEPVPSHKSPGGQEPERAQRVWRVIPTVQDRRVPAWVTGKIVHEALALWRFPAPGFDAWTTSRARRFGVGGESALYEVQRDVSRLLQRFRESELYGEMDGADRRLHEVPVYFEQDGTAATRIIDALYRQNGRWTLADFKTDSLDGEPALQKLLAGGRYQRQLHNYGTAVERQLGEMPRLLLCLLDYQQQIHCLTVD